METGGNIEKVLQDFINRRSKIWQKYDKALEQEAELNKFRKFDNPSSIATLPSISETNTPPDEVAAAVWELKKEAESIKQGESSIHSCQRQIEETKNQFKIIVIGGTILLILLLWFILSNFL